MKKIIALFALISIVGCGAEQTTDSTEAPEEREEENETPGPGPGPGPTSTATPAPAGQANLKVLSWSVTKAAEPSWDAYEPNDEYATYLGGSGYIYDLSQGYIDPVEATVTAEIQNVGNADAAAFAADVWIDASPTTSARGALSKDVTTLAAGAKTSLAFTVKAQDVAKTVKAVVKADAAGAIAESDENDNVSPEVNVVLPGRDDDWFAFDESAGRTVRVRLLNLPADYDVELYSSNGTKVASSTLSGTSSESIQYQTPVSGRWYVRVFGYQGAADATQPYRLEVTVP